MALNGIINGAQIAIFLNSEVSVLSTSLSWSIEHKTRSTTCREGNGWDTSSPFMRAWSADVENLLAFRNSSGQLYSTQAGEISIDTIIQEHIINQEPVNIIIKPNQNLANGNKQWLGKAFVTSVSADTPNEDNSTYSVSLKGAGLLRLTQTGPIQNGNNSLYKAINPVKQVLTFP
tara:strand:- start:15419 stop:15943 length:525 start_codon:yes stop_codon:yes gene_type:complete